MRAVSAQPHTHTQHVGYPLVSQHTHPPPGPPSCTAATEHCPISSSRSRGRGGSSSSIAPPGRGKHCQRHCRPHCRRRSSSRGSRRVEFTGRRSSSSMDAPRPRRSKRLAAAGGSSARSKKHAAARAVGLDAGSAGNPVLAVTEWPRHRVRVSLQWADIAGVQGGLCCKQMLLDHVKAFELPKLFFCFI